MAPTEAPAPRPKDDPPEDEPRLVGFDLGFNARFDRPEADLATVRVGEHVLMAFRTTWGPDRCDCLLAGTRQDERTVRFQESGADMVLRHDDRSIHLTGTAPCCDPGFPGRDWPLAMGRPAQPCSVRTEVVLDRGPTVARVPADGMVAGFSVTLPDGPRVLARTNDPPGMGVLLPDLAHCPEDR